MFAKTVRHEPDNIFVSQKGNSSQNNLGGSNTDVQCVPFWEFQKEIPAWDAVPFICWLEMRDIDPGSRPMALQHSIEDGQLPQAVNELRVLRSNVGCRQ